MIRMTITRRKGCGIWGKEVCSATARAAPPKRNRRKCTALSRCGISKVGGCLSPGMEERRKIPIHQRQKRIQANNRRRGRESMNGARVIAVGDIRPVCDIFALFDWWAVAKAPGSLGKLQIRRRRTRFSCEKTEAQGVGTSGAQMVGSCSCYLTGKPSDARLESHETQVRGSLRFRANRAELFLSGFVGGRDCFPRRISRSVWRCIA